MRMLRLHVNTLAHQEEPNSFEKWLMLPGAGRVQMGLECLVEAEDKEAVGAVRPHEGSGAQPDEARFEHQKK